MKAPLGYWTKWIFGSGRRKPDWVFVLRAYFDETEKDGLFLLGGFIGNCDQWNALEQSWDEARKGRRVHLSDMRVRSSTAALLKRLGPLPHECGLTAYYTSIRLDYYEDMLDTEGARLAYKPYPVCLPMLLAIIHKTIAKDENIKFAFERNDLYDAHACAIFEEAEADNRTSSGGPRFTSWEFFAKDVCPLLETADYFSFAQRERINNPGSRKAQWSSPIIDANPGTPVKWEFTRDQIRKIVAEMAKGGVDHGPIMSSYLREIRRARHPKIQKGA